MPPRSRPPWKACKNNLLHQNWPITTLESNMSLRWNVDVSTSSRLMLRSSRHTAYRPWGDRRAGSPGATGRPGKEVDPLDRSLAIRQVTKEKISLRKTVCYKNKQSFFPGGNVSCMDYLE